MWLLIATKLCCHLLIHAITYTPPAGIDSRGGMELRQNLANSFGLQLPVTLLYDYQSVAEIVGFVSAELESAAAAAATGGTAQAAETQQPAMGSRVDGSGPAAAADAGPSKLLKLLRPPAVQRPLFLAAPGVANAQSAYFAFSAFLQWSDQPIYVLDKDNDLDIEALAQVG